MIAGSHVIMWVAHQPPGNDACRFAANEDGLIIEGSARNTADDLATRYRVRAKTGGETRRCRIDRRDRRLLIERDKTGIWTVDGVEAPEVAGALDVDLGFTPATNSLPIRRLGLEIGRSADLTVAWLDPSDWRLKPMAQTYRRTGNLTWQFVSPGFQADLTVDEFGAVTDYPGWWNSQTEELAADLG